MRQIDGSVGAGGRLRLARCRLVALLPALAGVMVTGGCHRGEDAAKSAAALTVPLPGLTEYALLAARSIGIGQRNNVANGDVAVAPGAGAPSTLTVGIDSRVGVGQVVLAQTVTLLDRAVAGEVGANQIHVSVGVVTGPRSAYVAPPAGPTIPTFTAGSTAVTVNMGQTLTRTAGDYGAVTVNGTLNLSGGVYEIQSLRLGPSGRLVAQAASTVRVQTGLAAGDRADIVPAGGLGAGALRLFVNGTIDGPDNSVSLGTDVELTGIVVVRNTFRAADRFTGVGAISARDVVFGNDSRHTFAVGFACASNAACNDSNPCTSDTCVNAACIHSNAPTGTACSDGNACTQTDTCQAGTCTGGNPVVCVAASQCQVAGTCNPATGTCANVNAPDGTTCSDGNACTQTDACVGGTCAGGNPVICVAASQCQVAGTCNPGTGTCANVNAPDGTTCSDGNACTQTDTCQAGACAGDNPVVCVAADQCQVAGTCNPGSGTCSNVNAPDGTACSDANACTQTDACLGGACAGGNPIVCMASDQCHVAGMCNPGSGTCSNVNAPDGTACNDGDLCSTADACQGGSCTGGGSIVTEFAAGIPQPKQITPGPDGNLWFISTEAVPGVGAVARIAPSTGVVTSFLTDDASRDTPLLLDDIVAGADGNLWFTGRVQSLGNLPSIGSITPSGTFIAPDLLGSPGGTIAAGPDGNLWTGGSFLDVIDVVFRNSAPGVVIPVSTTPRALVAGPDANVWLVASNGSGSAFVGRVAPGAPGTEVATEFPVMTGGHLNDIAVGPDGNLWFTDAGENEIGRITTAGVITKYPVPSASSGVHGIIAGPDGNLWFTENTANKIARMTPAGVITELACIPTANSGPTSITVGADGKLWLTETNAGKIARVQTP